MLRNWKKFRCDERGNIAILASFTLPVFIGGIAFGTEAGHWFVEKSKLSFVTDAAALSAGQLYNRGVTQENIQAAIRGNLLAEGYPDDSLVLNITYPDSTSDLMTVRTSYRATKYFSQALWNGNVDITGKSVVAINGKGACILALNKTESGAVTMGGSATATLNGCVVASNSTAADSIYLGGSTTVAVDCMISSGGIYGEDKATTDCQKNLKYRRATKDPYADLVQPKTPFWCEKTPNFKPTGSYLLDPGCFKTSLDLKGTVTFEPGVYILDGIDMKINSGAVVTGHDVTFVLKNGATLNFNGGATIDLRAPEEGSGADYPGILFWGSKSNNTSHKINGDASSFFSGAIYLPDDEVEFTGSSGMDSTCTRLVADTITLLGNNSFSTDCTNKLGPYDVKTADAVVLVE
ncbi:MAG: hypothetical protein CL534_00470 [Ahrensia sp.]|nr:hypothetical protein [Ahrensia sp.]